MKVLVTGVAGQLGHDVVQEAKRNHLEVIGVDIADLDLTNEAAVVAYFAQEQRDDFAAIIHCAAYTAVDKAEDEPDVAQKVNVDATTYLVKAAEQMNAKFMYISTDYVYAGLSEGVLTEESPTAPVSVYGKTKLAGEDIVQRVSRFFIVRTSWVFGLNGNNFVKTMLKLSQSQQEINVVNDQFGSPTYTFDLAKLLIQMVQTEQYGIYQASNEGFCSWYEFALEIFQLAKKDVRVNPVASSTFAAKAERPHNSRMSKAKLVESGFSPLPSWQDALKRYLQLLAKTE